ncbi:MAG TPA: hypothetical protein VFA55_03705 [Candidatus Kapabacteria bacterium]|nr:hypothetical protein [Candidatus Kapabacteria bacterium]
MHLIDISTLKSYLNITSTTYDTVIDELQSFVDGRIADMCNQSILQTTATYTFNGNGMVMKVLPNFPVTALSSLSIRSSLTNGWVSVGTLGTDYELTDDNRVYYPAGFVGGIRNYQAVYTYGYVTAPESVQQVALEMCDIIYKNSDIKGNPESRLGRGNISFSEGGVTQTKSFLDLDPKWRAMLKPYAVLPEA